MNVSTVSNGHVAAVQNAQRAAATKATQARTVTPTDSDGDHDGSTAGRIDVRA